MKETAIYGISTIIGRFINFLLVPLYTNVFPPEQYGIVANLYAYIGILTVFFLYGLDSAYLKFGISDDYPDRKLTFSTAFFPVFTSSLVLALGLSIIAPFVSPLLGIPISYSYLINYSALILLFDALTAIPYIALRLENKSKVFVGYRTFNIILTVLLNIVLILYLKMGIEAVFISNVVASVTVYVLMQPYIYRHLNFVFSWELSKRLFRFGLPYLPAGLAAMLIQVVDRPIVEKMVGLKQLGIYQANYRLGIIMMLFVSTFQSAWQPFFLQRQHDSDARQLFSKILTLFSAVGLFIVFFVSLFITEIATFSIRGKSLIGVAYQEGLSLVPVILLGYFFYGLAINFSAAFFIKEKSMPVAIITAIACLVNIVVNILLLPVLGLTGAALATLFSYLFVAGGYYYFSNKFYPLPYEWGKLIILFVMTGALYAAGKLLNSSSEYTVLIKTGMLVLFITAIPMLGLVSTHHVKMLIQSLSGKLQKK